MACSFPYIEKNFRKSNPDAADKLNQIGLDTWTEIKDSNLFTKKEGSYVFNKQGTIRREKQNQLVNSINDNLGGNVVTEVDKKVAVNLTPIFNKFQAAEPTPQIMGETVVLETPTISEEPVFPKVDTLKLEWDEYQKTLENPEKASLPSLYLLTKFKGYDSLEQYKEVATGANPQAFSEYADNKLYELLKDFTDTVGVGIKDISDFQQNHLERTGKIISAAGVADLINKTIYVADGNLDALTEEVAHFIIAMLPKENPLYQAMDAYIENTPEFAIYYDVYLDKYEGNDAKTRDEIMGKIIKNVFMDKKEKAPLSLKTLINYILEYISSIFSDKALQYRQATTSIKQMFFAQNLVESLSDLDTSNEEMYQLSYDVLGDMATLESTNPQTVIESELDKTFDNITTTLENYAEKSRQTGNSVGLQIANNLLLQIKNRISKDIDRDTLFVQIQKTISEKLNNVSTAFHILQKNDSSALTSLFAEGGQYNANEMAKLENQEYTKRLKQIGSYINYIQNLKDLAITLNQVKDIVSTIETDNPTYKEIVKTLNPDLANNALFKQSMKLMTSGEITKKVASIEAAYTASAKIIVDGLLAATSTADQKDFLEKNKEITSESTKDSLTWMQSMFSPVSMQSDKFLQDVNSFVNFVLRKAQDDTFKAEVEILELKQELGNVNQEFMSSKDEKGNLTFNLLSKFNYTTYSKQKTQYLLDEVLPTLINNPKLSEAKDFLIELQSQPFESSTQIYEALGGNYLAEDGINNEDYNYINNFLEASENLYNLKRYVPSQGLSDVVKESVKRYIETSKRVYTESLNNPNFDWSSESVQDAISSEIDTFDLYDALAEKIDNREKLLKKQYYTFDEDTTDIKTNLPFKSQYYKVEGLLNYYKSSLGYVTDKDGLFIPSFIKINKFGEQYLFDLSEEVVDGKAASYIDEEYKKLEEEANDVNNKNNKEAIAKLKLIDKQKEHNILNNNPINSLASYAKRESEFNTIKFFGKRYRMYDLISRIAIPIAFATYITPAIMTGDFSFSNQLDIFSILPFIGKAGAFMVSIAFAGHLMRAFSIATDNLSRDVSSITDVKNIAKALYKSLGQTYSSLDFELSKEEAEKLPTYAKYDADAKSINILKILVSKIKDKLGNKKVVINTPTAFQSFSVIPQWQKNAVPAALRSTQFIDNFIQDIASTNDYNAKVSFEGVLKHMDDTYKNMGAKATGTSDFIENAFLNRVWYGKVASKSNFRKVVNIISRTLSKMFLTGNVLADVKNLMQAQIPLIVKGGPLLYTKASVRAGMYSINMLWKSVKNNKMAAEENFIQQIKKRMRILQQTGITERDSGQSLLANKLKLTNPRLLNALGESFIASQIVFMMLEDNKLVDEKGKKYDIVDNFELKDGIFQLKKDAPQAYFNFITKGQVKQLSSVDLDKINPAGAVSVANISDEGKKMLTPSTLDVQNYINISFFKKLDYFSQKTQGVYNLLDKPLIATTAIGHAVYMFSNHLASNYAFSLGAMKRNVNTSELEIGFIRGTVSLIKDMLVETVKYPAKAINNFLLKHSDSYKNNYVEQNKNQIQNIKDYMSIKNNSVIFATELFALSNALSAEFSTTELRKIANKIYNGELEYNDLGNSGKSEEEIYKTLYSDYITKKELNNLKAKSLRQFGIAVLLGAGMYQLATGLLAKAMGAGDDEDKVNEWQKFIALLSQILWVEAAINFSGLGILQKLGVNVKGATQQKVFGKATKGDLGIWDVSGGLVSASFLQENLRNAIWALSAFAYNHSDKKSLWFYDDKQEKVLMRVTGGSDLPYFRPQYSIKTKPSGKKGKPGKSKLQSAPINMVKQEFLDILFSPKYRDFYKQNPLKAEYYKTLPSTSLGIMNVTIDKQYVKQTGGRVLIEDITPATEQFKETVKP